MDNHRCVLLIVLFRILLRNNNTMKGYHLSLLFSVPCLILSLILAQHVTPQAMDGYCRNVTQDPFSKCVRQSTCWFFSEPKPLMKGYERKHYCADRGFKDNFNDQLCCCPRKPTPKISSTVIDIVNRKCEEYANYWCAPEITLRRIIGPPAQAKDFPHMVRIGTLDMDSRLNGTIRWFCSGTLISERFVLTAAHCVENTTSKNELQVGLITMYNEMYTKPKIFRVVESIIHPNYDRMTYQDDVALLQLKSTIEIDERVTPICLPVSSDSLDNLNAVTVAGWGDIGEPNRILSYAIVSGTGGLLKGSMCLSYGNTDCEKKSSNFNITFDSSSMICAVSCARANNSQTCSGDSGGPAQILRKSGAWTQVGIITFGTQKCGDQSIPSVFSKISHYIEWIQKNVWPEGS